jgi:TPR repeat protein
MRLAEAAPQPPVTQVAARRSLSSAEASSLVSRAREKLEQGDIAAARRLLERAAEADHGEAIFALAETYDPQALARWRVLGTKADAALARSLYQKAASRGAKGTGERLLAMQ